MIKFRNWLQRNLLTFMLFGAYSFFNIGSFYFTVPFFALSVLLVCDGLLVLLGREKVSRNSVVFLMSFLLVIVFASVSGILAGADFDISSLTLYLFYLSFVFFAFNNRGFQSTEKAVIRSLKFSSFLIVLFSAFGIIQFAGQFWGLSYIEFLIPGHMTQGFNTTNYVYLSSFRFLRAHSIYLEPSFLSMFGALGCALLVMLRKGNDIRRSSFAVGILLNIVSMVLAIAGTGLILLLCITVYWLVYDKDRRDKRIAFALVLAGFILAISIWLANSNELFRTLFLSRTTEMSRAGSSGYIRFFWPYKLLFNSLFSQPFGYGPGNTIFAIRQLSSNWEFVLLADTNSSYAKMGIELGAGGLLFYLALLAILWKKTKGRFGNRLMVLSIIVMGFLGGMLLSEECYCLFGLLLAIPRPLIDLKKRYSKRLQKYCLKETMRKTSLNLSIN